MISVLRYAVVAALLSATAARASLVQEDLRALLAPSNAGVAALGLGLAGLAHHWDGEVEGRLDGRMPFEATAGFTNIYGSSAFGLPAALALWSAGTWGGKPRLAAQGSALLRTLAYAQMVVGPIKLAARRRRPDGSNRLSFPSGHTANAFAIARLYHRHYGRRPGLVLYGVAFLVAAGRLEDERHFLSDVVMGAALGLGVGNAVHLQEKRSPRLALWPDWVRGRGGVRLRLRF